MLAPLTPWASASERPARIRGKWREILTFELLEVGNSVGLAKVVNLVIRADH